MDLAWLTLLALLAVVAVSCTTRVNPGVVAIVLAWLIAAFAAPLFGQTLGEKAIAAGFPSELFLTLLGVSLLFAQAETNGTLTHVAEVAQTLVRSNPGLIPILFFFLALALGSVGPGNIAVAGLLAPVAMAAASRAGISPFLMALMVGHGAIATSVSPFTAAGIVANQKLAAIGLENVEWRIFAVNAVANAIAAVAGYLLCGGWQLWLRPKSNDDSSCETNRERHPMTTGQVLTLVVIVCLVLAVVIFRVQVGMAAFAGAALIAVLRLADEREAFQKIPWSILVMVCGVSILTSLLDKTGGTERFAGLIGAISTPRTVAGILAFVTGIVSIYSSTTGVVLPAFLPMVQEITEAQPGSNPLSLALAVLVGGNLVDMSPLSTIRALCLAAAPATANRRLLFNQLMTWGFALAFAAAIASWLCF